MKTILHLSAAAWATVAVAAWPAKSSRLKSLKAITP